MEIVRQITTEQKLHHLEKWIAIFEQYLNMQVLYLEAKYKKPTVNIFESSFKAYSCIIEAHKIASQPIPKFPSGGVHSGGMPIVGEQGREMIIKRSK